MTAYDSSGNGRHGTVVQDTGSPTWGSGFLSFSGRDDMLYRVEVGAFPDFLGAFSIEARFRLSGFESGPTIISKWGPATWTNDAWGMSMATDGKLNFYVQAAHGPIIQQTYPNAAYALELGRWYHALAVFRPREKIELFVNGSLYGAAPTTLACHNPVSSPVMIGNRNWLGSDWNPFLGDIDYVRIYDGVHSPAPVTRANPLYPFPYDGGYQHGLLPTSHDPSAVQQAYETWLEHYYEESGDLARIKWDTPNDSYTVSEGIGYGMLIFVYLDNETNNTRDKFDRLWHYHQAFQNSSGLMHWMIREFRGVVGRGSATDAELDVALALVMGFMQWGEDQYLNDAKELIKAIRLDEVDAAHQLKPGDSWDDAKNPSYLSIVALRLFAELDSGYADFWHDVIGKSYELVVKSRNPTTGLVPDWCTVAGASVTGYSHDFLYDAVRTPWRLGWDYVWNGDERARDIDHAMAEWIKVKTSSDPSRIVDGYSLDGREKGQYNNAAFVGAFAVAGMVGTDHQKWLDTSYEQLRSFVGQETYYNKSLQVLYLLLSGGYMPNLYAPGEGSGSHLKYDSAEIPLKRAKPPAFSRPKAGLKRSQLDFFSGIKY